MTTNPERLYVCAYVDRGIVRRHAEENAEAYEGIDLDAEPVEYVRADVAAAAVANAPGYETAMAEANRASGLEDEVAALRAEVQALRERNKDLRGALLAIQKGAFYDSHWSASDVMRVVSKAVQLDDDAAAKGVG